MNYNLNEPVGTGFNTGGTLSALSKLFRFMTRERARLLGALAAILVNAGVNLAGPLLAAHTIDTYIRNREFHGVLVFTAILGSLYLLGLFSSYLQTQWMGGIGQRMLFGLRNAVYAKLLELPVAFFQANKAGDLISRINNDTDKVNQFFSQSLMQFVGSLFIMTGSAAFLLAINPLLGAAVLAPALVMIGFTRLVSPWVRNRNALSLKKVGLLSSEIQESLQHFRVIVAFNRRDYFRKKFQEANRQNYQAAIGAGIANNIFIPVFGIASNLAQLIVVTLGVYLIATGHFTIGLLISFLAYSNSFYSPLRQLAALWTNFQVAMAGWDRISHILSMQTDIRVLEPGTGAPGPGVLEFRGVHFHYPQGQEVLHEVTLRLEKGKTYALVGPTGGGKSTTASLMARLYDPSRGQVLLEGRDIRSYPPEERTNRIGFILLEPFLFSGTLGENIVYGNEELRKLEPVQLLGVLEEAGLGGLLDRFEQGLGTQIASSGDSVSLGQKQLIAFIRAVLRRPSILILDEATANIDTVTEQLLETILSGLPEECTRVIIAHRLNTIEHADEIFFVNSGSILPAGSMEHAVQMLLQEKRAS